MVELVQSIRGCRNETSIDELELCSRFGPVRKAYISASMGHGAAMVGGGIKRGSAGDCDGVRPRGQGQGL